MKKTSQSKLRPTVSELEGRVVPAVADPIGTFAVVDGRLALPNQATSPRLDFNKSLFRFSSDGVAVKIIGTASDGGTLMMGPAVTDRTTNPLPSKYPKALPSVFQLPAGRNAQIVNFRPNHYVFPVSGGWTNRVGTYHLALQLVGDANGDGQVNNTDMNLMRQLMANPASVAPKVYYSADYDGSGVVDRRDLQLARQNMGAISFIRPLDFGAAINTAATPSINGYVRSPGLNLSVAGSPGATFMATNLSMPSSAETAGVLPATGMSQTTLPLVLGNNVIAVSAHDAFGQSREQTLAISRLPIAVLVLPDIGGTVPINQTQAGLDAFYGNRGVAANSLTISSDYTAMLSIIAASGYQPGRDVFAVPYDWRLGQAPTDANQDGTLSNLTTTVMTQTTLAYQVNYFGQVLATLAATDPTITTVDIVGVGNGTILARSYAQSPALGGTFGTAGGPTYKLPTINKLFMTSAQNEGIPQFYNPWVNDFTDAFGGGTAGVMTALNTLYSGVAAGTTTIPGPDVTINQASILDPVTQQPNPQTFARLYFPSFRQNVADYDFLSVNGQSTNVNGSADSAPTLLLDLNHGNSQGNNPWVANVAWAAATFGVSTSTISQLNQQSGQGGTVWPIGQAAPIPTVDNQIWYQPQSTANFGDGVVPLQSLLSSFPNDPKVTLQIWNTTGVTPPAGLTATATNGSVTHIGLLSNTDFLTWLRNRLVAQ